MRTIEIIEFPKAKAAQPETILEIHPLPWSLGMENESMAEILDTNHQMVTRLTNNGLSGFSGVLADRFVNLVNALGDFSK